MKTLFTLDKEEQEVLYQKNIEKSKFDDRVPGLIQVKMENSSYSFSIWKCMLSQQTNFAHLKTLKNVMIILFHGGDFAATIFDRKGQVIAHKSFHKYIIRKGQGKKQSSNDKSKHTSSTGSQMRRENEKNLLLNISEWKRDWKDNFAMCDMILVQIPDIHNFKLLFPQESDLEKVSTIPFNTGKANHENTLLAWQKVIQVKVTEEDFTVPEKEMTPLSPDKDFRMYFPVDPISTPTPIDRKDFDKFFSEKIAKEEDAKEKALLDDKKEKETKVGPKRSGREREIKRPVASGRLFVQKLVIGIVLVGFISYFLLKG